MRYVRGRISRPVRQIVGGEGIRQRLRDRQGAHRDARAHPRRGDARRRSGIVVTEMPYQVNKTSVIERIAELVRDGRLDMISDLRDESDRSGMRIVIELKRGAQPRTMINRLLKYTPLQTHLWRPDAGAGRWRTAPAVAQARR